ncbi:YjbF family lipoprotein [Salinisphaera sp. Q1T1-3]|uniref:YjbF family lipoprotein n=1 Tax=Salinisphaera sp. Q1T1-3 TaxID=2321229 RepID=UPI000E7101E9|nr:YjbF family lipoprotein [Salinisphaera sp. Q1T1-3]RJS92668.1 hypothetical protein D3260_10575 [Salinisphaera sp. Q1T1-3]
MTRSRFAREKRSRRKAAFLCAAVFCVANALSGCARFDANDHPLLSTLGAFIPSTGRDVSQQAETLKYATIKLSLDGRGGLLVLSEQQPGVTYWQSSQSETVVLTRGYPSATAGLGHNLQMTRFDGLSPSPSSATPFVGALSRPRHYQVTRQWTSNDDNRTITRTADAVMRCDAETTKVALPLATLPLRACHEKLRWQGGGTTKSTYWIDPKDNRIWKGRTQLWPGGFDMTWEVARPWW